MTRFDDLLKLLGDRHHLELDEARTQLAAYEEIERDRLEHKVRGRVEVDQIDKVVLHGMFARCTKCEEVKPASAFGLLTDKKTKTVRNQPQCRGCRSNKVSK